MGEIADDMLDGSCCQECSTYFVRSHGHPVLCRECWTSYAPRERARLGVLPSVHEEA